ncbi:MAG: hypothetical protein ACRESZ_19605 [Methylococcales bacterium]
MNLKRQTLGESTGSLRIESGASYTRIAAHRVGQTRRQSMFLSPVYPGVLDL